MARKLALFLVMIVVPGGLIALLLAWLAHRFDLPARWRKLRLRLPDRRLRAPAMA